MMHAVLSLLVLGPAHAQLRTALPAPLLPLVRIGTPLATPALAPRLTPVVTAPAASALRSALPAAAPVNAVAAPVVAPAEAALPAAAEAARPALAGKASWTGLFDGRGRGANPVHEGLPPGLADELDFWRELTAHDEGRPAHPMTSLEAAAFKSFLVQASAWTDRVPSRAKAVAPRQRPETGRHPALLEAAARWRRLLRKPLDAQRAADIAGEVRNHREAYLSKDEPGLPGYKRAAADLVKLEAALAAGQSAEARALVDRFEEDLIHRRSLRVTVVIRQRKEGGNKRSGDRFVLPGTTLGTLLKRVGGRAEHPEVRLDRGEWTRYSDLNLRRKLADETLVEVYLPDSAAR